jgi:hypothetical protein
MVLRPARTGTMTITHTPARPTDTTALIGSPAESSSAPARGSAAAIMVAVVSTADEASTAVAGITAGAVGSMAVADLMVAVAFEEAPGLGALEGEASRVEEVYAAEAASKVAAGLAVEEAHVVVAVVHTVAAATGKFGFQ